MRSSTSRSAAFNRISSRSKCARRKPAPRGIPQPTGKRRKRASARINRTEKRGGSDTGPATSDNFARSVARCSSSASRRASSSPRDLRLRHFSSRPQHSESVSAKPVKRRSKPRTASWSPDRVCNARRPSANVNFPNPSDSLARTSSARSSVKASRRSFTASIARCWRAASNTERPAAAALSMIEAMTCDLPVPGGPVTTVSGPDKAARAARSWASPRGNGCRMAGAGSSALAVPKRAPSALPSNRCCGSRQSRS